MKWWDQPGGFTARFNAGSDGIRTIPGARWIRPSTNFVWIHDQVADVVPNGFAATGEFGGINMSVVGYLDGRSS
jgi:hypothetical protein